VLIVVVRYFGGTKLGISGLVHAYREAAKQALETGNIVEKEPSQSWVLTFDYPDMNGVMHLVKELKLKVLWQHFEERCKMILKVPISKLDLADDRLNQIPGVKLEMRNEK
jgi:putative IMPACT (imprinted ancient) family translation regulator